MQQQPVSNLFSSVAESKEIQTLLTEQLRTVEKITISFMQNPRLQQTGDTSIWYIQTLHLVSFFSPSIPAKYASPIIYLKGTFTNRQEPITRSEPATSKPHLWNGVFSSRFILFKISCGLVSDRQWDQRLAAAKEKQLPGGQTSRKFKL